jgi:PAS domain S-box-containing protein
MSEMASQSRRTPSIRQLAESRMAATGVPIDLETQTPDEIRRFVHELEVHRIELEIQNQQLEEAQREAEVSRGRFRQLYESAPIGYLTLDADGVIVTANPCAAELLQIPLTRLLGRKLSSFVAAEHQDRWHFARRALTEGGERRTLELGLLLDDGATLEVGITASGQHGPGDTLHLGLLDMTELRSSERALRTAASAASLAEQHERRKLAAGLHDDAGQLISLASIKLRALGHAVGRKWVREFEDLSELLAEVRRRVTSLSFQMSPPLLHDVGLVAATRWLAEEIERSYGLVVTVVEGPELVLDEVTRVTLFQAIRELLINVKKHSGVDRARVQIWLEGAMVQAAVEDDGCGFARDLGRETFARVDDRGGFGLLSLRDRVRHLGGTLSIGSGMDGSGSRVVVRLPLLNHEGSPA